MIYSRIPAPTNRVTAAHNNLTITGSRSNYSDNPPQTPAIILSFSERYNFFSTIFAHLYSDYIFNNILFIKYSINYFVFTIPFYMKYIFFLDFLIVSIYC